MITNMGNVNRLMLVVFLLSYGCMNGYAQTLTETEAPKEQTALEHARQLLDSTLLIDGHNDLPWAIRETLSGAGDTPTYDLRNRSPWHTDLDRLAEGRVGAQFWSIFVPADLPNGRFAVVQLEQIDLTRRLIARYPDRLSLALTADEIEQAHENGRIASLLGMEGGHVIENSLGLLRCYYDLGARYLTLTHTLTIDWADSGTDVARHGGLSPFGEEVVREMNRLGMLVDLSHVSDSTAMDALRVSEAPVIFSHSSARALTNVPRNVPDDVLKRVPQNGGAVMVTFVPSFVSQAVADSTEAYQAVLDQALEGVTDDSVRTAIRNEFRASHVMPRATVADVADHIEHIRAIVGVDHVGIGSDFDGISTVPLGLEDTSTYPNLFAELIRRGWSDEDLRKLAGENVLRVLRAAEATARRLQQTRKPSTMSFTGATRLSN